jgi:hypothetical protein
MTNWQMASKIIASLDNEPGKWKISPYHTLNRDDGIALMFKYGSFYRPIGEDGSTPELGWLNECRILKAINRWKRHRVISGTDELRLIMAKDGI